VQFYRGDVEDEWQLRISLLLLTNLPFVVVVVIIIRPLIKHHYQNEC